MLGPSGTGKSVFLKTLVGLLKPDAGSIWIEGTDLTRLREHDLYEVRKLFGVLFQDGALFGSMNLYDNVAFPLREHTKKSESEIRAIVMEKMELVGLHRRRGQAARRDLRRHAQARRPGARPGARPRDPPHRRARLRPRPGAHGLHQPAVRRPQRPDRRDLPHRHARHQHRAHGARQHRAALPPPPGDVRPARDAAQLARSRSCGSSSTPRRIGPIGMSEEKDADELAAEVGPGAARRCRPSPLQLRHERRHGAAAPSARPASGAATTASPRRPGVRSTSSVPGQRPRRQPAAVEPAPRRSLRAVGEDGLRGQPRHRRTAAERLALRARPRRRRGRCPSGRSRPGVHRAGLVHRQRHDPADGPGLDPVRRRHRAAAGHPDPPARRPVVHRRRRACSPSSARPAPIVDRAAHRRRRRARRSAPTWARARSARRSTPWRCSASTRSSGWSCRACWPRCSSPLLLNGLVSRRRRRRRLLLHRHRPGRHAGRVPRLFTALAQLPDL